MEQRVKAALHNLGCKVNEYETAQMAAELAERGYEIVPFAPGADIYIINTCTVTNIADRKSRQMLHRAKKMNPEAVVAACGCYVDVRKEELKKDPLVDILLTNEEKKSIADVLDRMFTPAETGTAPDEEYAKTRAFLKVQDGCNQFCTYCIIPYARGPVVSRNEEEILKEAAALAEEGYQEVVLTGIHLSSYGTDRENGGKRLAWKPNEGIPPLLSLIRGVAAIPGIRRIRLGSLEPRIMSEAFTEALSQIPEFCPQFHLSLQSGCDSTLKRMNRHYTAEEYKEICERIRKYFPDAALTTDIIAGFPGETEEEFQETLAFVRDIRFSKTHIFRYSRREGTPAASRKDQVPEPLKAVRSDQLIRIGEEASKAYAERFIGREVEVLFEEKREIRGAQMWTGHTKEYIEVCMASEEDLENKIVPCILTGADPEVSVCVRYEEAQS